MCGVHLIVDKKNKIQSSAPIESMIESTRYRGPDRSNWISKNFHNKTVFLGSNQLDITDSSDDSSQPLTKEESTLVYNGEIYNKEELVIKRKIDPVSNSDTEVFLDSLRIDLEPTLSEVEGMFAFVMMDSFQHKIHFARDLFGIKPLFTFNNDEFLIVSSEIKAILSSDLVEKKLNESAVYEYLQFRHCQYPTTFFKGISEVSPGKLYSYNLNSDILKSKDIDSIPIERKVDSVASTLEDLLFSSIQSSIPKNLDYGVCLSGGVDSTLIMEMLQKAGEQDINTYTIRFEGDSTESDSAYAKKVALHYNSNHHEINVDLNCFDDWKVFMDQLNQPIGDSGFFANYLLGRKIGEEHKVAFSGAGADELFAGYNRHWFYYQYLKQPKAMRAITLLPDSFFGLFGKEPRLIQKLKKSIGSTPEDTYNNVVSFQEFRLNNHLPGWNMDKPLRSALEYDRNRYLVSDVLALSDQAYMLSSVELRVPFLNPGIRNLVKSIDDSFLFKQGRKWILKSMLEHTGIEGKIIDRPKKGFGLPFNHWMKYNPGNIFGFLDDQDSLIFRFADRQIICDLYKQHKEGTADFTLELWNVCMLSAWLTAHFD